jgi:hypothetical protein
MHSPSSSSDDTDEDDDDDEFDGRGIISPRFMAENADTLETMPRRIRRTFLQLARLRPGVDPGELLAVFTATDYSIDDTLSHFQE